MAPDEISCFGEHQTVSCSGICMCIHILESIGRLVILFTSNEEWAASFASYELPCYFVQWAPAYPPSSWPWQPNHLQNPRLDKSRRGRVWCHRSIAPGSSGAWALASTYFLWPHAMQHNYWRTFGQPALNAAAN